MEQVNIGVVGLGWAASGHLAAFRRNPKVRVTALCTSKDLLPAQVLEMCGHQATVYHDYGKFLDHRELDVVDICTPHPMHPRQAIDAARKRKHLMIEKPLALDYRSLLEMRDEIRKAGVKSTVYFELRYIPHFALVKSLIARDLLGKVHHLEVDYYHGIGPWYAQYAWNARKEMGGSALITAGCHALDALLYFADREVEEVYAYSSRTASPDLDKYEYDTTSVAILKFADGSSGKCVSSVDCRQPYLFNVHLVGSEGTLWNDKLSSTRIQGVRKEEWIHLPTTKAESGDVLDHPYPPQVDDFVRSLLEGTKCMVDFAEAFRTHRVMFAIERSLAEHRPVKLSEME